MFYSSIQGVRLSANMNKQDIFIHQLYQLCCLMWSKLNRKELKRKCNWGDTSGAGARVLTIILKRKHKQCWMQSFVRFLLLECLLFGMSNFFFVKMYCMFAIRPQVQGHELLHIGFWTLLCSTPPCLFLCQALMINTFTP